MFFEKKLGFLRVERGSSYQVAPTVFILIKADNGYRVSMYVFNIMGLLNIIHGFGPPSHTHGTFLLRLGGASYFLALEMDGFCTYYHIGV